MNRVINGLVLTVLMVGFSASLYAYPPGNGNGLSTYDTFPKQAGQRTLIDFNDYNTILNRATGYMLQRYGIDGDKDPWKAGNADLGKVRDLTGKINGQPIDAVTRDPNGEPDTLKVRPVTEIDALFEKTDPLRKDQETMVSLRNALKAAGPNGGLPAAKSGTGGTTSGSGGGATATVAPLDDFGATQYLVSEEDLHLDNWLVSLNSSAKTVENRTFSYTKEILSFKHFKNNADGSFGERTADEIKAGTDLYKDDPAGQSSVKYLGVRIHFPDHKYNAYAKIGPGYDIPAFDSRGLPINYSKFDPDFKDDGSMEEDDPKLSYNGVMHNVSQIKNIVCKVAGRNYNHGLALRLRDQNGEVSEYFLGYLNFVGWRYLRWENPNYITKLSSEELFRLPLYPNDVPYRVFDGFIVYRNGEEPGGDFVTYIAWVKMDFDLAVSPEDIKETIDVDDDSWWYIQRDENAERNRKLLAIYAEQIDLRKQAEAKFKRKSAMENLPYESTTKAGDIKATPKP